MDHILLKDENLDPQLKQIAEKVYRSERISPEEGIYLYDHAELGYLGSLANYIREKKHGNKTYFNKNFHLEPTNVCIYSCSFCSYSRKIKKREDGWEYTMEEMMDIVRKYDNDEAITEIHIVGGVLPQYDVKFYSDLYKNIKKHRPQLHIKALTPVEYHYMFKKDKISYEEGMALMKEAGLDSLPGGGAEIFDEGIRDQIAGGKCSAEEWLKIHEIWHNLGMKSNATMLYGHIETSAHRIDHLERLRKLQDKTGGFQTYIPLKFRNKGNEISHLPEVSAVEDLRNYAIGRIYLDNFDHIKAYWPMIGRDVAQMSMAFGVDDIDGTIDDTTKIYSMAGGEQNPAMTTQELVNMIKLVNRNPIERDTLYHVIKDYTDHEFENEVKYRSYELPVINR